MISGAMLMLALEILICSMRNGTGFFKVYMKILSGSWGMGLWIIA